MTTTHGFCQQVLLALGTAGDHDPGAVLVEDIADLVAEVADDLYLRKWGGARRGLRPTCRRRTSASWRSGRPPIRRLRWSRTRPATGLPGLRARVADAVRREVRPAKRRLRLVDYDDMLIRLADTLLDPVAGPVARARLQGRYRVVLVDEFQDTDPVQWSILREAFHGHRTLVLIGDPKQAIYGFRGADVHAYLEARAAATVVQHAADKLAQRRRLLEGMDAVFGGAALGDPRIRVVPVEAAPSRAGSSTRRFRCGCGCLPRRGRRGLVKVDEARRCGRRRTSRGRS